MIKVTIAEHTIVQKKLKIVVLGTSGVGKSSIIQRYCKNNFKSNVSSTIGIDFQVKKVRIPENGEMVTL